MTRIVILEDYLDYAKQLPSVQALAARADHEQGVKVPRPTRKKPPPRTPPYLAAALKKNARARKTYENFSPSQKRDYVVWLTDAKQEATRERRLATAIEWMAEGKSRNWKYQNC
jgi:uncharacterized protein YdeI (YjbR/CyaY-like superfamily)